MKPPKAPELPGRASLSIPASLLMFPSLVRSDHRQTVPIGTSTPLPKVQEEATARVVEDLVSQLEAGERIREARMARFNTVRKCLNVLLDKNLMDLMIDGDPYVKKVTDRGSIADDSPEKVADEAQRLQEFIWSARPEDANPARNSLANSFKSLKAHVDNSGSDDALGESIDSYLANNLNDTDSGTLLHWFDEIYPLASDADDTISGDQQPHGSSAAAGGI